MPNGGYGQFCPVAMASEVLCSRWTMLVLRELCAGSTRFNDLRRGVPRMSPTLLSKRLRELEAQGVIERVRGTGGAPAEYRLTAAGRDLRSIIFAMGVWGQRWVETHDTLKNLDPSLLMWDMRRNLDPTPLPRTRSVIQFMYPELARARQNYWLIVEEGEADLCAQDPGFDVDLYVVTDVRTMTAIWMGLTSVAKEARADRIELTGRVDLKRSMQKWLGLSPFARERNRRAA